MLVDELEGLDESQRLVDISANGEVSDAHVAQDTLSVNNVCGSVGNTAISITVGDEAAIVSGDLFVQVGDHRDLHGSKTSLFPRLLGVGLVSEVRIDRTSDNLSVACFELRRGIGELADFSGAHEGEIKGPEEKDRVLTWKHGLESGHCLPLNWSRETCWNLLFHQALALKAGAGLRMAAFMSDCIPSVMSNSLQTRLLHLMSPIYVLMSWHTTLTHCFGIVLTNACLVVNQNGCGVLTCALGQPQDIDNVL